MKGNQVRKNLPQQPVVICSMHFMTQEDYDTLSKLRNYVYDKLDVFDSSVDKIKINYDQNQQVEIIGG